MASKFKQTTLFVPALSCAAAMAFAGAVNSGETSHLPCYDDAEKCQRFCETMGPMGAMAVYMVDFWISEDGTVMSGWATRHHPLPF